jgi:hypothetical protein
MLARTCALPGRPLFCGWIRRWRQSNLRHYSAVEIGIVSQSAGWFGVILNSQPLGPRLAHDVRQQVVGDLRQIPSGIFERRMFDRA